ncbi:MAG TPA: hypothetical protein VIY48_21310 [Candidatus Paceibacterota bacterium]
MTKYLYIFIGILLVGAAAVFMVGYLVRQPANTPGNTSTTGNAQPVNDYTVGVTTGTSGASGTTSAQTQPGQSVPSYLAPDISTAYSSIFVTVGATPVSFARVQSAADPQFGSVYSLFKNDVAIAKQYAPGQDISIGMASVDLNGDGTPEVLVYEDLPSFCGTGGCELQVYTKGVSGYKKVFSIVAAGEVGLLGSITGGYQDLAISTNMGTDPHSVMARYTWRGSTYAFAKSLAVWNGQRFVPLK